MTKWIALDVDNSWSERLDKLNRLTTFPQPLYLLPGPGLFEEERFILVSDAPWTPERVQETLADIYNCEEVNLSYADEETPYPYDAWVNKWLDLLAVLI